MIFRRLPRPCCTWCGCKPHDGPCPTAGCPCAYRKPQPVSAVLLLAGIACLWVAWARWPR